MARGDITPVTKWQANLTDEQRATWKQSMRDGHKRSQEERARAEQQNGRQMASDSTQVLAIAVHERKDGAYVRGSSRTIILKNCPVGVDGLIETLLPMLRDIPNPKQQVRKSTTVLDLGV